MKKHKKIFALLTVFILGCSDNFTDLYPESGTSEKTFFQTEEQFERALIGVYSSVRATVGENAIVLGEQRSDNAHYVVSPVERNQIDFNARDIADFNDDAINGTTNGFYGSCYTGISRANTVIQYLSEKSFSETFKNSIEGQAKFLRAYFYFELVRYYGGVPLSLKIVTNAGEDAFLPRSTVDEVYTQIIKDLEDADRMLGNPVFNESKQSGRVSKGSAKMLLARVLMTKSPRDYIKAETLLKEITNMGYSLISYDGLFDTNHKNSVESIFEVQFQQGDNGQESNFIYFMLPLTQDTKAITGLEGGANISNRGGGFAIPTEEMVKSYEAGDLRLNRSIRVAVGTIDPISNIMKIDKSLPVGDPDIPTDKSKFCYFVNKYNNPHSKIYNTDDNWYVYRYADVLLSLAECLVENGKAGEATQYVNLVRDRAGLTLLTSVDEDVVANERRHEFAFEAKRWQDLVRTSKAIEVMTAYGIKMKEIDPQIETRSYNVTKERLIFPIPYRELQINNKLTQNPGYN